MDLNKSFYKKQAEWTDFPLSQPSVGDVVRVAAIARWAGAGTKRVLELGAGTGQSAAAAADLGHSVIAVELIPQAVACALADTIVSAKHKRIVRRNLLNRARVDISKLTNIDMLDAALCALAAHHLALGTFKKYGEAESGLIVVPGQAGEHVFPMPDE